VLKSVLMDTAPDTGPDTGPARDEFGLLPHPGGDPVAIRPIRREDLAGWRPLWDGYNRYYGRAGERALAEKITQATWERFLSPAEPVHALVAELQGRIVGLAHYLFHRSTTRLDDVCYLQDLYTEEGLRGRGVGRALIAAVCKAARAAGSSRVYWQTQASNAAGRALYDQVATHGGFIVYSREL
jgi:GNAT superfamily N-acetyltransferase